MLVVWATWGAFRCFIMINKALIQHPQVLRSGVLMDNARFGLIAGGPCRGKPLPYTL